MSRTPIEWTEQTWNPVRGCSPVSPGCKNCYAERVGGRFCKPGAPFDGFVQIGKNGNPGPHWTGKVELMPHMLDVPFHVKKPTTWFVNSMSDLFHEGLPDEAIDQVFAVMALCPQHTFQVLTKRAERMRGYFAPGKFTDARCAHAAKSLHTGVIPYALPSEAIFDGRRVAKGESWQINAWPLPNVWLGVSVEDRERLNRIDHLRQTPAAVRFVSFEPLLEDLGEIDLRGIDLAIWGGESGTGARECHADWIRNGMRQAKRDGCKNFVKQLGANAWIDRDRWHNDVRIKGNDKKAGPHVQLLLNDTKGGEPYEWPEELRVRETPRGTAAKRKPSDRPNPKEESEGDSFQDFQPDDTAQEAL